jgi:hypothetical protein
VRAVVGPSKLRLYVRYVCGGGAAAEAAAAQPRRPRRRSRGGRGRLRAAATAQPRGRGGASALCRRLSGGGWGPAETDVVRGWRPCRERLLAALLAVIGAVARIHLGRLRLERQRLGSGCTVLAWGAGGASTAARLSASAVEWKVGHNSS